MGAAGAALMPKAIFNCNQTRSNSNLHLASSHVQQDLSCVLT